MEDCLEPNLCDLVVDAYEGDIDEEGMYDGEGEAKMVNKCVYEGFFLSGMMHGKGFFSWPNGVSYEGDFNKGSITGIGVYMWPDGSSYEGDVVDGKRHGTGKFLSASGQLYEGEWSSSTREGNGTMWYNKEKTISYKGDWIKNQREGYGIMKYETGNTYEGEWKDDRKSGRGVMIWRDLDQVYSGEWERDFPHGQGELIWGEGAEGVAKSHHKQFCNIFRGAWVDGKRSGLGSFFYSNGSQYTGYWSDNKKHGFGLFVQQDGKILFGKFESDHMTQCYPPLTPFTGTTSNNTSKSSNLLANQLFRERESPDIAPQIRLNVQDLLSSYPRTPQTQTAMEGAEGSRRGTAQSGKDKLRVDTASTTASKPPLNPSAAVAKDTSDIERLLLRFNSYIHALYRKYTDLSNKLRLKRPNTESTSGRSSDSSSNRDSEDVFPSQVEATIRKARDINKRLYCLTQEQLWHCCRDVAIIGPYFSSYDVTICLKKVRLQQRERAREVQHEFWAQHFAQLQSQSISDESPLDWSSVEFIELDLISGLGDVFTGPKGRSGGRNLDESLIVDTNPSSSLIEREFGEVLVRCIAESSCRAASATLLPLYDTVFKFMAEKIQPVSSGQKHQNVFVNALYEDSIQTVIYDYAAALKTLWAQLVEAARRDRFPETRFGVVQFRHMLKVVKALRGIALDTEVTMSEIMEAMGKVSFSKTLDITVLSLKITYDDFVEMWCRLIVSDIWIYDKERGGPAPHSADQEQRSVISVLSMHRRIAINTLANRLKGWLQSI